MRKLLLASGAAVALGFGATDVRAQGIDIVFAAALSQNNGSVVGFSGSFGTFDSASATDSIRANRGVTQASQNAGAGSLLQNSAAVAVVDGVRVSPGPGTYEVGIAVAASQNNGSVATASVELLGLAATSLSNSVNSNLGVTSVNQNAGSGSLMQNSVALAAFGACGSDCVDLDLGIGVALSQNNGQVAGLTLAGIGAAVADMNNSVRGNEGITQVSQNAGANSMTQNSVAVGAILPVGSTSPFNFR
jgi:hypothetical protein